MGATTSLTPGMLEDGYAMLLAAPGAGEFPDASASLTLQRAAIDKRRGLWGGDRDTALAWSSRAPE